MPDSDAIKIDSITVEPNVLIRSVDPDDLEQIRLAAAEQGRSVQNYLRETVHAQAAYLRRQEALAATTRRLQGRPAVGEDERTAVLDAIENSQAARSERLSDR